MLDRQSFSKEKITEITFPNFKLVLHTVVQTLPNAHIEVTSYAKGHNLRSASPDIPFMLEFGTIEYGGPPTEERVQSVLELVHANDVELYTSPFLLRQELDSLEERVQLYKLLLEKAEAEESAR